MLLTRFFISALAFTGCVMFASLAQADSNVLFIVDASGSMKKQIDGKQRMDVAKKVLDETLAGMPKDTRLGLMLYGHRKAKDCSDIELSAPIGGEDAAALRKTIAGLNPIGETPIADSLRKAAKSFNAFKGQQNSIVLVTDGVEECKGDPCAAAKELKDAGLDVKVNIVGFTLSEKEGKALECVADITGGKYYSASDAAGLTDALKQVQKQVQDTVVVQTAEAPKPTNDILAEANGGTLVSARNDEWGFLNKDHENFAKRGGPIATYSGAGIWSFKDGKPATFDQIEVLVPDAYKYNLKDFEVLAADELAGPYRSLGSFTVQNVKIMPKGWQGFKFPETKAKFVKVVFKTDQGGGYIRGNALRLIGKIDESAPAAEKPAAVEGSNIFAQSAGGNILVSPKDDWKFLNDGKPDDNGFKTGDEGVWAFANEKPATFSAFDVLIPGYSDYCPKEIEVLVGDEGPTGAFRSLGVFTVQNLKVMPDGWQRFTFPKVQAKYIKVKFVSSYGSYVRANEFAVIGKAGE